MSLRVGIIGLGVGEAHIPGFQAHRGVEVTALCDFSSEKLKMAAAKYPGVKLTKKANEILDDKNIDAVSIASFDNYHCEQILRALKSGKHVFVEKPACLFEKEAAAIRKELRKHPKLKFSSNLILRKSPRFNRLKKMISANRFGKLYYLEADYNYGRIHKITEGWRGKIDYYSVFLGGGLHMTDLLLWLTGDKVESVQAVGTRSATRGSAFRHNDCVASLLRFKSGMIAKVTSNFSCVHPHYHALSVYGTKASFFNDRGNAKMIVSRDPAAPFKEISEAYPGVKKSDLAKEFAAAILGKTNDALSSDEVFEALSVCLAVDKAAKTGGTVKVRQF